MGAKKMVAVSGMDMMPACIDCRFRWPGDGTTYCLAQSHQMTEGGWYMHHIRFERGIGYEAQKKWREPTCPLVEIEHTEDAYWWQESDSVVLCTGCDATFSEEFIHDIADYAKGEYPRYCPTCGAKMLNYETGEYPEEVL